MVDSIMGLVRIRFTKFPQGRFVACRGPTVRKSIELAARTCNVEKPHIFRSIEELRCDFVLSIFEIGNIHCHNLTAHASDHGG